MTANETFQLIIDDDEIQLVEVDDQVRIVEIGAMGPPGPPGPTGPPGGESITYVAAVALSGHRVVLVDSALKVNYAGNDVLADAPRIIGLTVNAASAGDSVVVQKFGELVEPSWNWNTSLPVYLGINGLLTQVAPVGPAAKFSVVVGFPITSTTLFVNVREPIILSS